MDHVVATIHPFVMQQEVDVYKNGECIKVIQCTLDDIEQVCYNLCKKYNIHQLDLCGVNQLYSLHIKENIDKSNNNKFNDFQINVEIH